MHLLDRIDHALERTKLDADDFERFAVDSLGEVYPGIAPVPRGTDWGRDADVPVLDGSTIPLAVTTSRTRAGVAANLRRSIRSLIQHGRTPTRMVVATLADLAGPDRGSLEKTALKLGVSLDNVYDRNYFALVLRRDGEWRSRLLGIPGDPISVSRRPPDLLDGRWGELPLIGRADEVELVATRRGDLLVFGVPGSGKSRLLAEVPDGLFVDQDARFEVVADDLRRLQPGCVVIDDAGGRIALVRQVRELRRQEPDLVSFRIVASCWPDECEIVKDALRPESVLQVELLERAALDEVLRTMGVTSLSARAEILHQAEGRPGWAVALGDVLVTHRDVEGLRSGRALFEQATRYFRRRAFPDAAIDTLATVALVGHLEETEVATFAEIVGIPANDVVQHLRAGTHSGFNDVQTRHTSSSPMRSHRIRPPVLADALVADRFFSDGIAPVHPTDVFDRWPARRAAIAETTIGAARLGAASARPLGRTFLDTVAKDPELSRRALVRIARSFGHLGAAEGEYVLGILRPDFDRLLAAGDDTRSWDLSPFIDLAAALGGWGLPVAIKWLLDAALLDKDLHAGQGNGPLRKIEGFCTSFHPELPDDAGMSMLVVSTSNSWLRDGRAEEDVWRVWSKAARSALTPRRKGAYSDPGDIRAVRIYETVAPPDSLVRIEREVWPAIASMLGSAPAPVLKEILGGIVSWLRIGAGYDRPFGESHAPDVVAAAREGGGRILVDFAGFTEGHPGLKAAVSMVGKQFGLSVSAVPVELAPFLFDVDRSKDWAAGLALLRSEIESAVAGWSSEDPGVVCNRLVHLREELSLVDSRWPSRVPIACEVLAAEVADTASWLDAALTAGLFPDAQAFLVEHFRRGRNLDETFLAAALSEGRSRGSVVHTVLTAVSPTEDEVATTIEHLSADDQQLLTWVAYGDLPDDRLRRLLVEPSLGARAATALALSHRIHGDDDWSPGALADVWLPALDGLRSLPRGAEHDVEALFRYLARKFPARLVSLVSTFLAEEDEEGSYWHTTHDLIEATADLPSDEKTALMQASAGSDWRSSLLDGIVGDDADWLSQALDDGVLTVREAIAACSRNERRPPLRELAKTLVAHGANAKSIAAIVESGSWAGDESARYDRFVDDFAALASDSDPGVAEVGRAGVNRYRQAAEEARQSERRERTLGYS